ncbi:MAG TPA: pitrilysin family protein [Pyrinomonadaceae bacterium]|nr:pitrilysin family protein [Pyrinomonadaceae bacterium]
MKSALMRHLCALALAAAALLTQTLAPDATASAAAPQRRQSTSAAARQQRQTRPAPSAATTAPAQAATATAFSPSPLANRVLANGLEVIVLEDHSVPLVTVELAVKNGSYTEPPEYNGLSHLYEHMFFKSARALLMRDEYIRTIDTLGFVWNGETHEELVNYYFTTTTPNFGVAMRFMRDSARDPVFVERLFEQERQVVIGELQRHESNPFGYLGLEMNRRLFYKFPSRKTPGGSRQTVAAATTDMMRTIQQRYYVPNNSALIVAGDVTPAEAFAMAESLFGDWPRAEDPFVKFPLVEHPPLEKSEGHVIRQPVQNVIVQLGWHGPSIGKDNAGTYAADVLLFILRQPDSRWQRALVDTGLVTGVDMSYLTQRNVGPITVTAQTTADKARAAVRAIHAELGKLDDPDYFTDEELENAKTLLEATELYSREKTSEYSHTLSFWWASTGLDYFRNYHQNLRRISRADIRNYVTTYIQGKPHVGLALMSEESARASGLTPEDLVGQAPKAAGASGR